LAGGEGGRLDVLTEQRAKPALPFGGTLRLIDFSMSNCSHSHLPDIWVVEQYELHKLNEHLANGRPWDMDRTYGGLRVLPPFEIHNDGKKNDKDDKGGSKDKDKKSSEGNDKDKDKDKKSSEGKDKDKKSDDKKDGGKALFYINRSLLDFEIGIDWISIYEGEISNESIC
jgi:hypothetical protein